MVSTTEVANKCVTIKTVDIYACVERALSAEQIVSMVVRVSPCLKIIFWILSNKIVCVEEKTVSMVLKVNLR